MGGVVEVINIDPEEADGVPVIINNEAGAIVTVNVITKNYNYNYAFPEWFNQDSIIAIIKSVRG